MSTKFYKSFDGSKANFIRKIQKPMAPP